MYSMRLRLPVAVRRGAKLFEHELGDQIPTQTMRRVVLLVRQILESLVVIMRRVKARRPSGARWNDLRRQTLGLRWSALLAVLVASAVPTRMARRRSDLVLLIRTRPQLARSMFYPFPHILACN
jgi:hypothetical protein